MKKMEDCKEYFKDVFKTCKAYGGFEANSIYDSTERAQYETLCETLKFIYGEEFKSAAPRWAQEALNEYFTAA